MIPLSADRVAMVIGDVMGHGIAEAAAMGRLRTAARTLAELEMPPGELFGHLNEIVGDLGEDCFATRLYSVFDPVAQTCTICSAGHPAPVVVRPDGAVGHPDLDPDPPLGAAAPPFATRELRLPGEHMLVFCTDGLLEAATGDAEQGLTLLEHVLTDAVTGKRLVLADGGNEDGGLLDDLCDTVVSALMPDREHTDDDAALLIARTHCTADGDIASFGLPDDPQAAGQARQHVREQLAVWGLDDLTMTTELLVSELVGNVVRHAKGPIRIRLVRSRSLICEVYDGSLSTPRIRRAAYMDEGGRGLYLVSELCRRWGARYLAGGKCIWAEQDLPLL
ncbi:ATP-binding SpoIIE family protein phosphatase [Streptomyces ipomoeae]|uniref:ATP-binding SpoIIE family protein phosphatase n=1 Tax=Streptomyces ipomoeae TaxID=103232 RepID=UPI001FD35950|nr:ATP-binding SpoIIE family protein phosphatase [Streptomyces ipomoeae]MDX2931791.1 serine/threonine-protein phosphatase [Streptomyces ipomoeae]